MAPRKTCSGRLSLTHVHLGNVLRPFRLHKDKELNPGSRKIDPHIQAPSGSIYVVGTANFGSRLVSNPKTDTFSVGFRFSQRLPLANQNFKPVMAFARRA